MGKINSFIDVVALKRAVCLGLQISELTRAGVLGDSLGSLRDGVLGQLAGQDETDSGLDFPAGDGGTSVVMSKT